MARKARRRKKARKGYRRNAARKTAQKRGAGGRYVKSRARKAAKRRRVSARRARAAWPSAKRRGRKGQTAKQRAASLRNLKKARAASRKGGSTKRRGRRLVGVKFARKTRRGVKKVRRMGTRRAKSFANKYKMRSNPAAMVDAMKQVLPIAASFYGSKLVVGKLAGVGAISGLLAKLPMGGKLSGPVLSGIVLAGVHYGTKKGAMQKYRASMMLGSAFALLDAAFNAFVPDSITGHVGVLSVASPVVAAPAATGGYFPQNEYVPQSEYIAQSDYVAMSDYESADQSPRQLHEVWGVHGIEEELGSDHYGSLQPSW